MKDLYLQEINLISSFIKAHIVCLALVYMFALLWLIKHSGVQGHTSNLGQRA